jgi:HlyD family secretion protein
MPERLVRLVPVAILALVATACGAGAPDDRIRVSGYVEATDVRLSAEVGGRLLELRAREGDRVAPGDVVARLDTRDLELALDRARAERAYAEAQLQLLRAGARREDIRQAAAQHAAADADIAAAEADLAAAEADVERFEALLANEAGSRKQRDDAVTRRDVARGRLGAARERARAGEAAVARLEAGARPQEIQAAEARRAVADAQIASLEKQRADATVTAPVAGIVTERLVDEGEVIAPRMPMLVVTDLDRAWAEVFVDAPIIPRLRIGQPATVHTDAGGDGTPGHVSYISSRAEFTPRNVQTADERAQLVYRVRVAVDNRDGVLKQGMPIEAEFSLQ